MAIRSALAACLLAAACASHAAEPDADPADEAIQVRVKAAFITKFASYVDWPKDAFVGPSSPLVIGVAGSEAMAREISVAANARVVRGRTVVVERVAHGERARDCCAILYVGPGREAELLPEARGRAVLTVTDNAEAHPPGSVINFTLDSDRVRFDISRSAAERNRLHPSSQLLSVAREVLP